MTEAENIENYNNSKFAKLNKHQRQKIAPIISKFTRDLNDLYLDEIYAILESIQETLIESSKFSAVRVPKRD